VSAPYLFLLGVWVTLQLSWVFMLLFVQFVQVARAMTTHENMYGISDGSAANVMHNFTSTGAPLDPSHPDNAPASARDDPLGAGGAGHGHAGHKHSRGFLQQWSRLLGVEIFLETARGRGAATGAKQRKKKNPYSRGYVQNCRDFWCDPAPVFGQRETGEAMLGGERVSWTDTYESPALMSVGTGQTRRGGYTSVTGEEV
jgi:palmitoyltransferase ZDHHC13/17